MRSIISKHAAREAMFRGAVKLAQAVGTTLGPLGRTVTIWKGHGTPMTTKDGVSVAKEVQLEDPGEAAGAELVKAAAKKTAEEAGDGTTTATILTAGFVEHGLEAFAEGANIRELREEFDGGLAATITVLDGLKKTVASEADLVHVASISANDDAVGKLIGPALFNVGEHGLSTIEIGAEPGIKIKETAGYRFDKGWIAPQFVADPSRLRTALDKCAIYITPRTLTAGIEVVPIFEAAVKSRNTKCLLMVVGGMESEALATTIYNRQKELIDVVVVKAPSFGERREEILGDIGVYTGGKMHSEDESFEGSMLGLADKVEVDRMGTTIFGGSADPKALEERQASILLLQDETKSEFDRKELGTRLQSLQGRAVSFEVGGQNETEAMELFHRVEDAVLASKAALRGGLLPGAGKALLEAYKATTAAFPFFSMALLEPGFQLLRNADIDTSRMEDMLEVGEAWMSKNLTEWNGPSIDLYASGIVDPYEVTVSALKSAVASAKLILGTDCLILEESDKKA